MSTYVIGFHDGWMHHPVASVESGYPPNLADSDADWCVELTDGDVEYMDKEELTALEYIIDLAHDGRLSHATGKHEHVKARHTVETYLVDDTPTLIEITSADWSISGRGAYREYRLED